MNDHNKWCYEFDLNYYDIYYYYELLKLKFNFRFEMKFQLNSILIYNL